MALTSGFFNSKNHDRLYDATQISTLFEGLINDGVYQGVGNIFKVSASNGMNVTVDTGRAWFNNTWTRNDALIVLTVPTAEQVLKRIDAVVLEVNTLENVRNNTIKIVKGTPASSPAKPSLTKNDNVHQYPLAYITVDPNVTKITQQKIQNAVGTSACPFVTGIIDTLDIDILIEQWSVEFNRLFAELQSKISQAAAQTIIDGSVTRAKLANDALYGPVVAASAGKNIQISDAETTFYAKWTSAGSVQTWTLNKALSSALPNGFIVGFTELWTKDKTRISLSGIRAIHEGDGQFLDATKSAVIGLAEQGSVIALKKMDTDNNHGDVWLISGNMEVIT